MLTVACVALAVTGVTVPPPDRLKVAPARFTPCTTTPVSVWPMVPYSGVMDVIDGGGINANVPELAVMPFTVTVTTPVLKPAGTCTTRAPEDADTTVAVTPPNCTISPAAEELKFCP